MGRGERTSVLPGILLPVVATAVLLCFLTGLSNLSQGQTEKDRRQTEGAIRRAAVACYAAEGVYPPDLEYLQTHYGIQINEKKYVVKYESYGSNLMPDITILDNEI